MDFRGWMALCGALLLLMALSSALLKRLPVSTSIVYMAVGLGIGPLGAGWLRIDLREATPWLEPLTEIAVIISLFMAGLKLRAPLQAPPWRSAFFLAGPVMLLSIVGVALVAHFALGLAAAPALLLGAILAPTDPVLASSVAVADASDRDRLRYGLSAEAGLNDGTAFPFVVFALLLAEHGDTGRWIAGWAAHRLLWAVPVGLVVGYLVGLGLGRLAITLRTRHRDHDAPSDLLALAVIAVAYVAADRMGAWGFLAAFTAGVGLRRAELKVVDETPHPEASARGLGNRPSQLEARHPPAEDFVPATVNAKAMERPAVAAGVLVAETLSFGDTAERLLEVILIVLVGASLSVHWTPWAVPLALCLFFVIRPLAVALCLIGTPTSRSQRMLIGWFGIRGIGSLYYLTYALRESGSGAGALGGVANLTMSVVALSIVLHGVTALPLLRRYKRRRGNRLSRLGC